MPSTSRRLLLAAIIAALPGAALLAQSQPGWSGNFAKNTGFEEDFVNQHAEGHILSFKGDWYYNQKDMVPDFWTFKGDWSWESNAPHGGEKYLKLAEGTTARQSYSGAVYQEGGGPWGGAGTKPIPSADPAIMNRPWRATVWVRNGGSITLGGATVKAEPSAQWQQLTVEASAPKPDKKGRTKLRDNMTVILTGPGEFDDLVVQEKLPETPNLIANAGFEEADADGRPRGWSAQRKYRAIGPTYYVWTDWNHVFRENRGQVRVDPLVAFAGNQSLRFDVYPGDEKYVESDPIALNQQTPGMIEVSVYVKADRIRLLDVRCVDSDGADLPGVYPIQPENHEGGSATYGNGTFDWRYVRKFFTPPQDKPLKSIRVRLAARGFNGHTLDDAGTRSYACQVGTLWWDNLYVTEPCANPDELSARGVKTFPPADATPGNPAQVDVDLGERFYGLNTLKLSLTNGGKEASFKLRLTTTLPGENPATTQSAPLKLKSGQRGTLQAPYEITRLAGDLKEQGKLRLELLSGGGMLGKEAVVSDVTYSFNTWPVTVDIDVARRYNLPGENPVSASLNLGVGAGTLAKVARLELALAKAADPRSVVAALPPVTDLKAAFARTLTELPATRAESYEFNMPAPGWWADRTNLLMLKLDLSPLKVWPHDQPTRDTVLTVRGLDAAGKELFAQTSESFGRMEPTPRQPPIESVEIRAQDGAVLINGQPRFLFGASHGSNRTDHTPALIAQLGLMGLRLEHKMSLQDMADLYDKTGLYILQAKPVSGTVAVRAFVDLDQAQRQALAEFSAAGGCRGIVSFNTGGWEGYIPHTPEAFAKHAAMNDWVFQTTKRPVAISWSGAFNAWNLPDYVGFYDINHNETEMWGPMDLNVIYLPYARKAHQRPVTWVYLPQLYDNTPFERYRFETYENIIRGSAGVEMIQGIGDPSFNRGLAGELRYLEKPLYSLEPAPAVTLSPDISHKVTRFENKTYILATNAGPIQVGDWKWDTQTRQSGQASHEGDTQNTMWFRPAGIRIHGMRGLPMPEMIRAGDKIVQYVWVDPKEAPQWVMFAVRGDGKFIHNAVLGSFDFSKFKEDYGNIVMYSELEHSVWHEIRLVLDPAMYDLAVKLMGEAWAEKMKKTADKDRETIDSQTYQPEHFHAAGPLPAAGQWQRIEIDAETYGLVGKLVDGFAFLTQNGRALWDSTTLERGGQTVHVFCEDTVGIDRALLGKVRINVPGLMAGAKVKVLFENRAIIAEDGGFTDNFEGVETYGYEAFAPQGDLIGFVKDSNRELPRMIPSGYGYSYGPTAVHIYEIEP